MTTPRSNQELDDWPLIRDNLPARPEAAFEDGRVDWPALWARPDIHESVWVAPGASVLGRVRLKSQSSIWYGCVVRGDNEYIEVGEQSNVQDASILHADPGMPCVLGDRVTLGHRALVHASVVENDAMIAIGATVLSGCHIGTTSIIAAGAVVMEGVEVPAGTIWAGCPARQIGEVSDEHRQRLEQTWKHYVNNGAAFLARYGHTHIDAIGRE